MSVSAVPITVPSVGESISEGILARWLKKDGESVKAGDPLFEIDPRPFQAALAQAQAARFTDTAALFQALGGGWWNEPSAKIEVPKS